MALNYILTCAELQKFQAEQTRLTFSKYTNTSRLCYLFFFFFLWLRSAANFHLTSPFFFLHQWKAEGNNLLSLPAGYPVSISPRLCALKSPRRLPPFLVPPVYPGV